MKKCAQCGKRGLFLKLDKAGLCNKCAIELKGGATLDQQDILEEFARKILYPSPYIDTDQINDLSARIQAIVWFQSLYGNDYNFDKKFLKYLPIMQKYCGYVGSIAHADRDHYPAKPQSLFADYYDAELLPLLKDKELLDCSHLLYENQPDFAQHFLYQNTINAIYKYVDDPDAKYDFIMFAKRDIEFLEKNFANFSMHCDSFYHLVNYYIKKEKYKEALQYAKRAQKLGVVMRGNPNWCDKKIALIEKKMSAQKNKPKNE